MWKRVMVVAGLALAGAQLVQPGRPVAVLPGDGRMADHVDVPPRIRSLLDRACADCHSDRTRWPWYARVSPVSWLIHRDVQEGRGNLDFSSWSVDPTREPTPDQRLRWMCENARDRSMPPRLYRWMHPEARLSEADVDALCAWTDRARDAASRETPRSD